MNLVRLYLIISKYITIISLVPLNLLRLHPSFKSFLTNIFACITGSFHKYGHNLKHLVTRKKLHCRVNYNGTRFVYLQILNLDLQLLSSSLLFLSKGKAEDFTTTGLKNINTAESQVSQNLIATRFGLFTPKFSFIPRLKHYLWAETCKHREPPTASLRSAGAACLHLAASRNKQHCGIQYNDTREKKIDRTNN